MRTSHETLCISKYENVTKLIFRYAKLSNEFYYTGVIKYTLHVVLN